MQDGARPHFVPTVHAEHYNHFSDQCIGHQEPIIWPPQSLCLMPCDFCVCVCGKPKEKVYQSQPKTLDELEQALFLLTS